MIFFSDHGANLDFDILFEFFFVSLAELFKFKTEKLIEKFLKKAKKTLLYQFLLRWGSPAKQSGRNEKLLFNFWCEAFPTFFVQALT